MIEGFLVSEVLIRMAKGLEVQSGLSVGIYHADGEPIYPCDEFNESDVISAVSRLGMDGVENVCDLSGAGTRISALAMRSYDGTLYGLWMVSAKATDSISLDSHLSMLEAMVTSYLAEREEALKLSMNVRDKDAESSGLTKELAMNEAITEILSMMESEDDFGRVAGEILRVSGEFLGLSNALIIQLDRVEDAAEVLCEWQGPEASRLTGRFDNMPLSQIPFVDGLSYTVSSDSRMPDNFRNFLRGHDISAGIFLPIFLDEENVMYLLATMEKTPRHWELTEASFLSDVKRVISSILAKRIAKNSLASSYAVVESVLENIGCGVLVLEQGDGSILYSNDKFRSMFSDLGDKQRFERKIRQTPEKMEQIREYYVENAGIYVSIALGMIRWVDDSLVRLATVFDITENKEIERKIEKQANLDELTGIYNRTYFLKELGSHLSQSHPAGAYICMNIDGFKEVNVTAGSEGGDLILSSVAKFLLKLSGENARVYRLGADEFAIIVKDSKAIDPSELSKAIVKRFQAPWQLAYKDCYLTASIGIALFPKDGNDVASVVKAGDIALSEARKRGSGSVVFFAPEMEKELRNSILLRSFLMDAIENGCNGMELVFEDAGFIVNNAEYKGYLGKLIWNAPEMGVKELPEFLPVAKKQHAEGEIFRFVLDEAAKECRYKNDFGYPEFHVGIGISAEDFVEQDIVGVAEYAIESQSVNPDRMVVIVRGSILESDIPKAAVTIDKLRKMGLHVANAFSGDNKTGLSFDAQVK